MGKGRFFGSVLLVAVIVLAAAWSGGCGTSNDQGISFRALGFFADGDGDVGDGGTCASLNDDSTVPTADEEGNLDGGFLGLQNNMAQGIQVERVNLSYRVSGSSLAIPNDQFPLSFRLGPSSGQEPSAPIRFAQIIIMGPQIFEFLNNNRSRLPPSPFTLVATVEAVGFSDAADVYTTNRLSYPVIMTDGFCVAPTEEPTEEPTPTPTPEEP